MPAIFHIGYPKSASTWLQENFFPKIRNIEFINRANTNDIFVDSDVFLFDPVKIRNTFVSEKTLLFSSESITTTINKGWHNGVFAKTQADKIKSAYPDSKILIIIRNQQSLITSAYQQFIKNGGVESFNIYLNSNKYFRYEHLLFHQQIKYYEKLFGFKNVHVYMYEDFLRNPPQFIEKLNEEFQFKVDLNDLDFSRVNRGLRVGIIPILRFFNLFHRRPRLKIHYLIHVKGMCSFIKWVIKPLNQYKFFGRFAKPSDFLKSKDLERIQSFYQNSNNALLSRFTYEEMLNNEYHL